MREILGQSLTPKTEAATVISMKDETIDAAATAVRKYKRGENISDEEMKAAVKVLTPFLRLLRGLGPEFQHAFRDLNEKVSTFEQSLRVRHEAK